MQGAIGPRGEDRVVVLDLAGEAYGTEIGRVEEIIRMQPISRVPHGSAFVEGMTNLRGRVVPVLDLRTRFGLPRAVAEAGLADEVVPLDEMAAAIGRQVLALHPRPARRVADVR